jgi:hypothetical protein
MKTYINGYSEGSAKHTAYHITPKSYLQRILNGGLRVNREGYIYLYKEGTIYNPSQYLSYEVRDAIAYNQLFLCEGEEAVVIEVDITELATNGEVWWERVLEPTEEYHRLIKVAVEPEKIVSYETFRVIDPFKAIRPKEYSRANPILPSNNKIQKQLQKTRHNRKQFFRELIQLKEEDV